MISIGFVLLSIAGGFGYRKFQSKKVEREVRDALIRDKVTRHEKVVSNMHVTQTEHSVKLAHLEKQIEKHDARLNHIERQS